MMGFDVALPSAPISYGVYVVLIPMPSSAGFCMAGCREWLLMSDLLAPGLGFELCANELELHDDAGAGRAAQGCARGA